jgi:hypothetical protein
VARGLRAPGAQGLEVVELEAVAAEVELHVLGERAVTGRQDEAIAADPLVVARVASHDLLEQEVGERREAHRRAGVTVAHLLDGVGCEDPRGVDRSVVDLVPGE